MAGLNGITSDLSTFTYCDFFVLARLSTAFLKNGQNKSSRSVPFSSKNLVTDSLMLCSLGFPAPVPSLYRMSSSYMSSYLVIDQRHIS